MKTRWKNQVVTDKQKQALKASIDHWRRISKGEEACEASSNCALCKHHESYCFGYTVQDIPACPIAKQTNRVSCNDTPYHDWDYCNAECGVCLDAHACCPKCQAAARKMLRWLETLDRHCKTTITRDKEVR